MRPIKQQLRYRLVKQNGRSIRVYHTNIPQFHGEFSPDVFELAAQRAYRKGWRNVVLTYVESFLQVFERGYCDLAVINLAMLRQQDALYRYDQIICQMDDSGEVYREPQEHREAEYDRMDAWL